MNTSQSIERRPLYAYVGSRTTRERNARGEGISVFRVEATDGSMTRVQLVPDLVNPSFLCLNRRGDRLYTVHGDGHEISVFAVARHDGTLAFLQRQDCGGLNPVHLALDPTEKYLVVSDHLGEKGGTLGVMVVREDGLLDPVHQRVALVGTPGPHRKEQPHAKPHFNPFDPSGRFVVVPDKGYDRVFVFRFADGLLSPAAAPWMDTREAAGPRHLAFHPTQPLAYVVNELDSSVVACRFDPDNGTLQPFQVLSTLPDTFTGNSRAAEIAVSPDGHTLYASNRGHDSIAVFRIDEDSGRLAWVEAMPAMGRTPRFFAIGPDGKHMYVLNEDSDEVVTLSIEPVTGRLAATGRSVPCGSPVCLVFSA
ncbi:MAG: Lactonase, 7-bladed beta propeller [Rhodoferax sp.]|nr:Lactonase, 7-bladed beta propeller [Rhodoferax sp.]